MSQPREARTPERDAPWLTGNGLWSPSVESTPVAARSTTTAERVTASVTEGEISNSPIGAPSPPSQESHERRAAAWEAPASTEEKNAVLTSASSSSREASAQEEQASSLPPQLTQIAALSPRGSEGGHSHQRSSRSRESSLGRSRSSPPPPVSGSGEAEEEPQKTADAHSQLGVPPSAAAVFSSFHVPLSTPPYVNEEAAQRHPAVEEDADEHPVQTDGHRHRSASAVSRHCPPALEQQQQQQQLTTGAGSAEHNGSTGNACVRRSSDRRDTPALPLSRLGPSSSSSLPSAAAAAAAVEVEWTGCQHSDAPARYRDVPALYCTYCSYTVCESCFTLIHRPPEAAAAAAGDGVLHPPSAARASSSAETDRHSEDDASATKDADQNGSSDHSNYKSSNNKEEEGEEGRGACGGRTRSTQRSVSTQASLPRNALSSAADMSWLDAALQSPSTAVRASTATATPTPPLTKANTTNSRTQGAADRHSGRHAHPHAAAVPSAHDIAAAAVIECHLCHRGQLHREEAPLHEWCCEGPAPPKRLQRGHALVYDTQNLQQYYFARAQRESRQASTAPLYAAVLSTSPAALDAAMGDGVGAWAAPPGLRQERVATQRRKEGLGRDPLPGAARHTQLRRRRDTTTPGTVDNNETPQKPTRRATNAAVASAVASKSGLDGTPLRLLDGHRDGAAKRPRSAPLLPCHDACEEGGSFVFAVRNPRLEVQLVWCAVNCQSREETPAYSSSGGHKGGSNIQSNNNSGNGHHDGTLHSIRGGGGGVGQRVRPSGAAALAAPVATSITPLLMWRCPPSLPGLPARPYRLHIPYGLYAFANVHAVALYVARDLFRKATPQLVAGAASLPSSVTLSTLNTTSRGGGGGGLASVLLAPAASLQPLLTVTVLHHVGTTPRPLQLRIQKSTSPSPDCRREGTGKRGREDDTKGTENKKTDGPEAAEKQRRVDLSADTSSSVEADLNGSDKTPCVPSSAPHTAGDEEAVVDAPNTIDASGNDEGQREMSWPDGLHSPELTLCIDHLLQGRSLAVYGIASKYFFLQHVASSAELGHFHVVTVDASGGRAAAQQRIGVPLPRSPASRPAGLASGSALSTSLPLADAAPGSRRAQLGGGHSRGGSALLAQLLAAGTLLMRRAAAQRVLDSETRARLSAAAACAGGKLMEADDLATASLMAVDRAAMHGDAARSPAVARDATSAVLRASAHQQARVHGGGVAGASFVAAVDVMDVDAQSNTTASAHSCDTAGNSGEVGDCNTKKKRGTEEEGERDGGQQSEATASGSAACSTPAKGIVREVVVPPLFACATPPSSTTPTKVSSSTTRPRTPSHATSTPDGSAERVASVVAPPHPSCSSPPVPVSQARLPTSPSLASPNSLLGGIQPPLLSPIPAFFQSLQRTVDGRQASVANDDGSDKHAAVYGVDCHPGDSAEKSIEARDPTPRRAEAGVVVEELPDYLGGVSSLCMPSHRAAKEDTTATTAAAAPVAEEVMWRAPHIAFASNEVRQQVLRALRRRHASRRCVQWASLPSPAAAAQLREQTSAAPPPTAALPLPLHARTPQGLLTTAHSTRPGWQAPLLLVVHSVDLLDGDEVAVLAQLVSEFAFPHPHLQLLLSFDNPLWPLSPLAAVLERAGVCALQLRSLLLPRVHEQQHVNSIHLLTQFEAAATAGAASGIRGKARRQGRHTDGAAASSTTDGSGGVGPGEGGVGSAGGASHLLNDTMRRVLFSLPPAFNSLLSILLDVQDEHGENVYVSLFTVTDRFERAGVMISQGRLKALLRELTSNRIARYDAAEHALMVPQVSRLRRVLEEVMAQRQGGGGGAGSNAV